MSRIGAAFVTVALTIGALADPGTLVGQAAEVQVASQSSVTAPGPGSPGRLLALGLLVPGLSHFANERPLLGAAYLTGATGAVLWGVLSRTDEGWCASPVSSQRCPSQHLLEESSGRPHLAAGLVAAAVITVAGATHAFIAARTGGSEGAISIVPGTAEVNGSTVRFDVLRVQF